MLLAGRAACLSLAIVAASGCGSSSGGSVGPAWQGPASGVAAASGLEAERYFPLKDGTLYHYRTEVLGDRVEQGLLMLQVHRSSATQGELRRPAGTQRFTYQADGVATTTKTGAPAHLLQLPLDPAARWVGPQGGQARLAATGLTVTTPAGSFTGCLTVLEERGGDLPMRVSTTLCPEVGIVVLEVQAGGGVERAELTYFGPPIDVGSEGVTKLPSEPGGAAPANPPGTGQANVP